VVVGAVVSHHMAARLPHYHGRFEWPAALTLAIVVFGIYAIDRLIDNQNTPPVTARHQFYAQHQPLLVRGLGALAVVLVVLLFFVEKSLIYWGLGLAAGIGIYLGSVLRLSNRGWFVASKDVVVPFFYALGTWGTALVLQPVITWEMLTLGVAFWFIAQQNLLITAYFESFTADTGHSLPITWGEETTKWVLKILFWVVVLLAIVTLVITLHRYVVRVAVVLILMTTVQHLLWQNAPQWLANERYRLVSEAVFLLPLLVW
jgi:hypothetical protein